MHANPATLCDGKYAETASLIDAAYAKYGTLYSGGLHHHIVDDAPEPDDSPQPERPWRSGSVWNFRLIAASWNCDRAMPSYQHDS